MDDKIRKEFKDVVETKEFKEIENQVAVLNARLKAMYHYRSRACARKVCGITKTWLKLEFCYVTQSVSRRDPLPLIIKIDPPDKEKKE